MAALMYHLFASTSLICVGLYHLVSATRHHLKSPQTYSAKPFHTFPAASLRPWLKHLQLYLLIVFLLIAAAHQAVSSATSDPVIKGHTPVHRLTSFQSAAVLFLFLLLAVSLLVSEFFPSLLSIPQDLFFALAAAAFFLQHSVSANSAAVQTSDLEAKCDSTSALVSALSSLLCLALAVNPKLFVADLGLGASLYLQGLWVLQTGLSLYVEAFIPEGCHRLLDIAEGAEGSTKCDLEESRLRAVAILDLVFVLHVMLVVITVLAVYAAVASSIGVMKSGSYEPLPTSIDKGRDSSNHIQMKSLTGTQA